MQAASGRTLAKEGRHLLGALASLSRIQSGAHCDIFSLGHARGYADDSTLLKTALYDFHVDQGGEPGLIHSRSRHLAGQ